MAGILLLLRLVGARDVWGDSPGVRWGRPLPPP